mgnify:CR=1 FL=1
MNTLPVISPDQARDHIRRIIRSEDLSVKACALYGPPGVAKTWSARAAANDEEVESFVIPGQSLDPTDPKGLQNLLTGEFSRAGIWRRLVDPGGPLAVILDDFPAALPAVQTALHLPLCERMLSDGSRVSDLVTWIITGNLRKHRGGTFGVLDTVTSRMSASFYVRPVVETDASSERGWITHASERGLRVECIAHIRMYPDHLSLACYRESMESAKAGKSEADKFPPPPEGMSEASPRTWEHVSSLLDLYLPRDTDMGTRAASLRESAPLLHAAIFSQLGAVAPAFEATLHSASKGILPRIILANPESAPMPPDPMAAYVTCSALIQHANGKTADAITTYIVRMRESGNDAFAMFLWTGCVRWAPKKMEFVTSEAFRKSALSGHPLAGWLSSVQ